jgi:hypothetical protein
MALIETIPVKEDYRRKLAQQLMREGMSADPVIHWAQGLGRMGQAALGGYQMYQADQRDKETEAGNNAALIAALGGSAPATPAAMPSQAPAAAPRPPQTAPMTSVNPQAGAIPAALSGPRPGGPVMPSAKVWGDKEAEDAGLYEKPAQTASLAPMVPTPVKTEAVAPTPAVAPAPTQVAEAAVPAPSAPQMADAKARIAAMLASDNPQVRKLGQNMGQALLVNQLAGKDKLEKLNDSTLFDPRTGRAIAIPGAEKPTVVGRDQRLVDKNGRIIVDQQPDKAVKITLSNGQEVTAIQNADGSFKIPEVAGAGNVTPKLSEGERDQIIKDEDTKAAGESAMSAIREARKLNDKAFSGAGAGTRAWVARNSPVDLGMVSGGLSREGGKATTQLDNLLTEQALGSMKAIFGGNPTEGERKVLLDLQASSSKSPDERKEILDRAEKMMARRIQMSGERANSIRGGSYFKPGGGAAPASPADALKQKYGLD